MTAKNQPDNLEPTAARAVVYRKVNNHHEFLIIEGVTGKFALIGGQKDDEDASLEDTLKREILEEVGLDCSGLEFINSGITRQFIYTAHPERMGQQGVDLNFIVEVAQDAQLKRTDHIINFHWLSYKDACNKISFPDLKEIFMKVCNSFNLII